MDPRAEQAPLVDPAHDGFYYATDDDLVRFATSFLEEAAAVDETALVVGGARTQALLQSALDGARQVVFVPSDKVFTRTATAVLVYQELVEQAIAHGARGVRALSEVDFGSSPEAVAENLRFEAIVNFALERQPLWNVCVYDVRRRPVDVVDVSTHAHPYLVAGGDRRPNPRYLHPAELLRRHCQTTPYALEAQVPWISRTDVRGVGLSRLRMDVHRVARRRSRLTPDRVDEYVEAVNELVTNALAHGSGRVALRLWAKDEQLVCTITDQGAGFDDPLAGFMPVPLDIAPEHGAGLWLARNFSDSLTFTRSGSGFTARVSSWSHRDPGYAPR
jgi:anti-sigma regulatory factor (Ser/Thr protein kinase)